MITIIHGDNTVVSRQYFNEIINKYKSIGYEVIRPEGLKDMENLAEFGQSVTLFGQKTVIVIENFLKQKGPVKTNISQFENKEIIFWEESKRASTVLAQMGKKTKILEFKIPDSVFQFLDYLRPGNPKNIIEQYRQLLKNQPAEMIFSFVASRFVDLRFTPIGGPIWKTGKLSSQRSFFAEAKLGEILTGLLEIDLDQKNSLSPMTLDKQLEVFFMKL